MNNNIKQQENAPGEYFDESSFKTLYGGVLITWVSTNTIVDLLGIPDPKLLGFGIALAVAFIGFFMAEKRTLKRLLVTPFNGFLIYLTIMGGTSFLPAPEPHVPGSDSIEVAESESEFNESVEFEDIPDQPVTERRESQERLQPLRRSSFTRSWSNPDQQLVESTRQLQMEKQEIEQTTQQLETEKQVLAQTARQLEAENQELVVVNSELQNLSRTYEMRLDSTRRVIERMPLSQPQRETIMPMLQIERAERTISQEMQ